MLGSTSICVDDLVRVSEGNGESHLCLVVGVSHVGNELHYHLELVETGKVFTVPAGELTILRLE